MCPRSSPPGGVSGSEGEHPSEESWVCISPAVWQVPAALFHPLQANVANLARQPHPSHRHHHEGDLHGPITVPSRHDQGVHQGRLKKCFVTKYILLEYVSMCLFIHSFIYHETKTGEEEETEISLEKRLQFKEQPWIPSLPLSLCVPSFHFVSSLSCSFLLIFYLPLFFLFISSFPTSLTVPSFQYISSFSLSFPFPSFSFISSLPHSFPFIRWE